MSLRDSSLVGRGFSTGVAAGASPAGAGSPAGESDIGSSLSSLPGSRGAAAGGGGVEVGWAGGGGGAGGAEGAGGAWGAGGDGGGGGAGADDAQWEMFSSLRYPCMYMPFVRASNPSLSWHFFLRASLAPAWWWGSY